MKILFIGGTGIISSACSRLALEKGLDLYHLNRGVSSSIREVPGVKKITCDFRDIKSAREALEGYHFDAVVDWIAFTPDHIRQDIELFHNRTKQFVFISSASAYQTPPVHWPVTEKTPLYNPVWGYSQNKIACEELLQEAYDKTGFPYTVVRPSHTYDKTLIPLEGGYTQIARMKEGRPVVIHGDGSSLWTLTHHQDFARGLVGLLGHPQAIGETYHITSDEYLSWDQIARLLAQALGVEADIRHIPSEIIARYHKDIGDSLLGDKTHSMIFDNTKIKDLVIDFDCTIPFRRGAQEIVQWYESHPEAQVVDPELDQLLDKMVADWDRFQSAIVT